MIINNTKDIPTTEQALLSSKIKNKNNNLCVVSGKAGHCRAHKCIAILFGPNVGVVYVEWYSMPFFLGGGGGGGGGGGEG